MFPVYVNDGSQELPNDDIFYIVCKEGVYLKKKLGIMESITPVKEISILKSIEMSATMHIKSIPGTLFSQVMSFFKWVYDEHYAEAIVLLFYDEEKKVYKLVAPAQEVSGASVDYNRAITIDGYTMVGDIHSHANMSAFHSGIDDKDEESFDGLHITIGNNRDKDVSISASIVSNGKRFMVDPEAYVNGIGLTVDVDEVVEKPYSTVYRYDPKQKKMVQMESTKTYKVKRFDKRYVSTVSQKYQKFPEAWKTQVTKKKWVATGYRQTYGGYGYGWPVVDTWRNWNTENFDPNVWAQHRRNQHQTQGKLPTTAVKPITFPPHDQSVSGPIEKIMDDNFNPCEKCAFKHHKIDWAISQFDEDETDFDITTDEDGNVIDWYRCDQCDETFSTTEDAAICPNCNVDDFLVLLDADDIMNDLPQTDLDWYRCKPCANIFYTTSSSPECPICNKNDNLIHLQNESERSAAYIPLNSDDSPEYYYKCKDCATETSVLNHGQCPFCGGDVMDNIDMDAIKAAQEEDETMENIPLPAPDENKIPLGTRKKQTRKPGIFASLFNKGKK